MKHLALYEMKFSNIKKCGINVNTFPIFYQTKS